MAGFVDQDKNKVWVSGSFELPVLPRLLATMHNIVANRRYEDLTLDFSQCSAAFSGPMLGLIARVQQYAYDRVDVDLVLPEDEKLSRLFLNSNWAHLLDFHHFDPSKRTRGLHVPAQKYRDAREQTAAVNAILESMLSGLSGFEKTDLGAIEWCINEVTDNVLVHAQSKVGGFVQLTNFSRNRKTLQFAVADPGIGIPKSLRAADATLRSDQEALDRAIREGVTRDAAIGQGNGLFGTWRVTHLSGGSFEILSGNARLSSNEKDGMHIQNQPVPYNGSLVVATISYEQRIRIEEALLFNGRQHTPFDYVTSKYIDEESGDSEISLSKESEGFGSRQAGGKVRMKITNLLTMSGTRRVIVDLDGIPLVSSSYADEVFGKLFLELGPLEFAGRVLLKNVGPSVKTLIDRAIVQRMSLPPSPT